ncbi:unnamed protein product [Closterium sp. NIES-54]
MPKTRLVPCACVLLQTTPGLSVAASTGHARFPRKKPLHLSPKKTAEATAETVSQEHPGPAGYLLFLCRPLKAWN